MSIHPSTVKNIITTAGHGTVWAVSARPGPGPDVYYVTFRGEMDVTQYSALLAEEWAKRETEGYGISVQIDEHQPVGRTALILRVYEGTTPPQGSVGDLEEQMRRGRVMSYDEWKKNKTEGVKFVDVGTEHKHDIRLLKSGLNVSMAEENMAIADEEAKTRERDTIDILTDMIKDGTVRFVTHEIPNDNNLASAISAVPAVKYRNVFDVEKHDLKVGDVLLCLPKDKEPACTGEVTRVGLDYVLVKWYKQGPEWPHPYRVDAVLTWPTSTAVLVTERQQGLWWPGDEVLYPDKSSTALVVSKYRPKKASGAPRTPKPKGTRECACGCGNITGGTFCMGHDAKVKSILNTLKGGIKGHKASWTPTEALIQYVKTTPYWSALFLSLFIEQGWITTEVE